jgi:hypothetical protein
MAFTLEYSEAPDYGATRYLKSRNCQMGVAMQNLDIHRLWPNLHGFHGLYSASTLSPRSLNCTHSVALSRN